MAGLVIAKQYCAECGADVTHIGIRPYGIHGGVYCYDCVQKMKAENYKPRSKAKAKKLKKVSPLARQAKYLHSKGIKPSKIAKILAISTAEVYEFLNA